MEKIIMHGGVPLKGTVAVSGAKNAVLPIIAASLLSEGPCRLHDIPRLADVDTICEVLVTLGARVVREDHTLEIDCADIKNIEAPYEFVRRMRASFLVMGPLLARLGRARMSLPGGCAIGTRPIDLHLKGFVAMGVRTSIDHGTIEANSDGRLRGSRVYLDFPSVGATENIMMAATLGKGSTIIENAAEEPEIVELANFINCMGGRITGAGTNIIRVEGVPRLHGTTHPVIPDRIEAGTYMVMAAATGGDVLVDNVIFDHLKPVAAKLMEAGVEVTEENSGVRVRSKLPLSSVDIKTLPYPGYPTDMQAQMMALLTTAHGTSVVTETVFENRFMHVNELKRMGASIVIEGHSAVVKGVRRLTGAKVKATDLRAGAALLVAGLQAEGKTEISGIHHIDRGYEMVVEKLTGLGARVFREQFPGEEECPLCD